MPKEFNAFLAVGGLKNECRVPYNPHQNRIGQRKNGSLMEWQDVLLRVKSYHILFGSRLSYVPHMYLTSVPQKHYILLIHLRLGMARSHLLVTCVY